MLFQLDPNFGSLFSLGIMLFHLLVSLYIFKRVRIWIIIFLNFCFSVIFGIGSFQYPFPMQIYLVFFDILLNAIYLTWNSFNRGKHKKRR